QKEQSKCRQGAGQSTRDKIKKKKQTFFKFSNFPPPASLLRPDVTGTRTQKPDAGGDGWGRCRGTHRGSEGQGKLCRDSLCNAAW
ncbi:unnamed protein product, partial [Staurois parvus]